MITAKDISRALDPVRAQRRKGAYRRPKYANFGYSRYRMMGCRTYVDGRDAVDAYSKGHTDGWHSRTAYDLRETGKFPDYESYCKLMGMQIIYHAE
jgi:hypothetical protein